jgi:glycosyltransferase involved in cell wall biosynthesis
MRLIARAVSGGARHAPRRGDGCASRLLSRIAGRTDKRRGGNRVAHVRVLWVIKGLGPGGAEHLLAAAAEHHDRQRFEIDCCYLLPWKDHLVGRLEAAGVACECLDVRDERDLRWVRRLRRRLRADPVNVLHAHSPYVAAFARAVARSLPRRVRPAVVTTEHNPWGTFKRPTRWANALTSPLDRATIAVSEEVRASLRGPAARRAETLAHGVDVRAIAALRAGRGEVRRELAVADSTVLVGTVANYHPKKDWPNLLHAARRLADRGLDVRFVAVGQGPLEADVHALHEELGLHDTVLLTGYRPDAVRLMAGCDCFVLASQWEGLPVALMEALALGLPVVSTAVGGIPEVLRDGEDACLVPPGDAAALADALAELAVDPAKRSRLGARAQERAADFDIARAAARLEQIYSQVARR